MSNKLEQLKLSLSESRYNRRGYRPCPDCGHLNGCRASVCRNTKCIRGTNRNTKSFFVDAQEIVSSNKFKVFSVRRNEREHECRNFVQIQEDCAIRNVNIVPKAICFICDVQGKSIKQICKHKENVAVCKKTAKVLDISRQSILELSCSVDIKDRLWELVQTNQGSVQQISSNIFVVASLQFECGFVHVCFPENVKLDVLCGCHKSDCEHILIVVAALLTMDGNRSPFQHHLDRVKNLWQASAMGEDWFTPDDLMHLFGSVISDSDMLSLDPNNGDHSRIENSFCNLPSDDIENLELTDCHIELMDQFKLTDHIDLTESHILQVKNDGTNRNDSETEKCTVSESLLEDTVIPMAESSASNQIVERIAPTLQFQDWLDSVIERIYDALDFNIHSSWPEELKFMIPNTFFQHLHSRFSIGNRQRLPNTTEIFMSGSRKGLSKHSYKFVNPKLVLQIFSTDKMSISLERRFRKTEDGGFEPLNGCEIIKIDGNFLPIRPTEYKTYLKIGPTTLEKHNRGTFEVTWAPNMLPKSGYGEMTIRFECGIMRNNEFISTKEAIFL